MGQVARFTLFQDKKSLYCIAALLSTTILCSTLAAFFGGFDFHNTFSVYQAHQTQLLKAIAGGGLFGIGMVLAGGCISRNIVRASSGNRKSVTVVLLTTTSAWLAINYPIDFYPIGLELQQPSSSFLLIAGIVCLFIAVLSIKRIWATPERSPVLLIPIAITLGWVLSSGWLTEKINEAMTFSDMPLAPVKPRSLNTIEPLVLVLRDAVDFKFIASWTSITLAGFFLGSLVYGLLSQQFRWDGFADSHDFFTNILGACMMGVGGVWALGCSFGMLSGSSVLSFSSMLAFITMLVSAYLTIKLQYHLSLAKK